MPYGDLKVSAKKRTRLCSILIWKVHTQPVPAFFDASVFVELYACSFDFSFMVFIEGYEVTLTCP